MKTYRCPMCFARDIDVVFLLHDAVHDEHYCPQCAYAAPAHEIEARFEAYRSSRYKDRSRPHPFASRRRVAENLASSSPAEE